MFLSSNFGAAPRRPLSTNPGHCHILVILFYGRRENKADSGRPGPALAGYFWPPGLIGGLAVKADGLFRPGPEKQPEYTRNRKANQAGLEIRSDPQ
jgi:hypothetical protein